MSENFLNHRNQKNKFKIPAWAAALLWCAALVCVFFMGVVIAQRTPFIRNTGGQAGNSAASAGREVLENVESNSQLPSSLPDLSPTNSLSIVPVPVLDTNKPGKERETAEKYTIAKGDSIYGIAKKYDLEPESVLWANYDVLHDDAHNISVGDELIIPPGDGIYYKWKDGDVLQKVADKYRVTVKAVLECPANHLDITNPVIKAGDYILLPGGYRDTMVISPITYEYAKNSGVKKIIAGPGGCEWDYRAVGTGSWLWPTNSHVLVGNDFWSGHMGVDLGTGDGAPISATDSGTVVYAGVISGGYGIMVMIDHGNGFQSLYAHLSGTAVSCGQAVSQGQTIGYGGTTGNSTGVHLHFEIRYGGGYVNPWDYITP